MARPCGSQRKALLEALALGPGTSRELAERAGLSADDAMQVLNNMVRKGVPQALVLRHERVPGCKRPVPVYGPVPVAEAESYADEPYAQLGAALFGAGWCGMGAAA